MRNKALINSYKYYMCLQTSRKRAAHPSTDHKSTTNRHQSDQKPIGRHLWKLKDSECGESISLKLTGVST